MLTNIVPYTYFLLIALITKHKITAKYLFEPRLCNIPSSDHTVSPEVKILNESLNKYGIFPKIYTYLPKRMNTAEVIWDSGEKANFGNIIPKKKILQRPKVRWPYDDKTWYSLFFTDIDDPQNAVPWFDEYHLWMVYNIFGNDIDAGVHLLPYMPPETKQFSHRIVVTILSHTEKILIDERQNQNYIRPERFDWTIMAAGFDLEGALHATNFFIASPLVENVHPRLRSSTTKSQLNISVVEEHVNETAAG